MLNKKRQELIIQNLKSISSQVRLMSIEQLVNLPTMPVAEKLKLLQNCLNDSEEAVQNAAKVAIAKVSGVQNNTSSPNPSQSQTTDSSVFLPPIEPSAPQKSNNSVPDLGLSGLGLPSLSDLDNGSGAPKPSSIPNKQNLASPLSNFNSNKTGVSNASIPQKQVSNGLNVPSLNPEKKDSVMGADLPDLSFLNNPDSFTNVNGTGSSNSNNGTSNTGQMAQKSSSSRGGIMIDGPVDPSLPPIQNSSDIGFLIQHISDLINKKPAGYLTRLFELAKSVHEEVALTALQNLFIVKDDRVPAHILTLLNDSSYTSQRRFLMLKIVMDTNVPLNSDLLENILVNEKDVIIKSGLVKVFAKNCKQDGVPLLIRCLNDEDPRVRANTVEVIEAQKFKGCEQEIIKLLNDSENRVKVNAAKYLVKIGYQQAFLTLRAMLVSPEVWLRDSVIFALGEIADQPSLVLLRAALKDPNQGIRLSVLKALARINNNMARQILKAASGDPDQVVAQVAMSLYDKIKDTPLREDSAMPANKSVMAPNTVSQQQSPMAPARQNTSAVPSQPSPMQGNQALPPKPPIKVPNPVLGQVPNVSQTPSQTATPPLRQPLSSPLPPLSNNRPQSSGLPPLSGLSNQARPTVPPRPAGMNTPLPPIRSQMNSGTVSTPTQTSNNLPPGTPSFEKPRSAEIYAKLCSPSMEVQRNGMRDVVFVMGQDQMVLLTKAVTLEDEGIRIAAVKLLARRKTPESKAMLSQLSLDSNETVSSLAKKALMLLK